jgi:outer membrane lipoprotein-sorting protein
MFKSSFLSCFAASFLSLFFVATSQTNAQVNVRQLLDKMYASMSNAKNYSYEMYSKERFGTKYFERDMLFRINETPKKVYAKDLKDGVEILYAKGWNSDKAYINPNGFPWTNVSFSVYNGRVRADNHHLVTTAGFAFTKRLLQRTEATILKKGKKIEEFFSITGETEFDGRTCYKFNMEYKDFAVVDYTVPKDIDLEALALDLDVPEYWVKERNKLEYGIVKAGKVLKVPTSYAKKVIFYIDKKTFLPIAQLLYDDQGLYEKYEYRKMTINFTPAKGEWTDDCSSYGF